MAENILTYVLNLQDNISDKLKRIGINNEQQLDTWAKVQRQVNGATQTMQNMGRSIGSMNERIAALRAQREWIPASNREAIRATNHEIQRLEREVRKLVMGAEAPKRSDILFIIKYRCSEFRYPQRHSTEYHKTVGYEP